MHGSFSSGSALYGPADGLAYHASHADEVQLPSVDQVRRLQQKIRRTRDQLIVWSKKKLDVQLRIQVTRKQLSRLFEEGMEVNTDTKKKFEESLSALLLEESKFWQQRAKLFWLKDDDANTGLFHRCVTERRRRNRIAGLYDAQGDWQEGEGKIEEIVLKYFTKMFTSSKPDFDENSLSLFPVVSDLAMNEKLKGKVMETEVKEALKQMHGDKMPGLDGFSPGFYKSYWDIVGGDVVNGINCFLSSPQQMEAVNHTYITLIPKTKNASMMHKLRSISLCNVIYKIESKVLANRLKFMDMLISTTQSAFVPGRLITGNTLQHQTKGRED